MLAISISTLLPNGWLWSLERERERVCDGGGGDTRRGGEINQKRVKKMARWKRKRRDERTQRDRRPLHKPNTRASTDKAVIAMATEDEAAGGVMRLFNSYHFNRSINQSDDGAEWMGDAAKEKKNVCESFNTLN